MKCFFALIARALVIGFFALNAWNISQNITEHSKMMSENYKATQDLLEAMSGKQFPPHIHHSKFEENAEMIILYLCYAILTLAALSLVKPGLGKLVAIVWLLMQVVEHELLALTQNRNFRQLENLAMILAVFMSGMIVSACSGRASAMCGKGTTVGDNNSAASA